eukprot:TRINITY_DN2583_c0_g1_i1.p2 TRINITY_DN2583_c0_g1~~TRINITY_DN2583_c0_g1_i1.p2  ORF type:complete len:330 (-),score=155.71 TRINITY_DN2583_c0_g1_i1:204-1193(-)
MQQQQQQQQQQHVQQEQQQPNAHQQQQQQPVDMEVVKPDDTPSSAPPYPCHTDVVWMCEACAVEHCLTSKQALAPFRKAHGFKVHAVPKDGDCFYSSVCMALASVGVAVTVAQMREWVAASMTQDHLRFYQVHAEANPSASWLDFVRDTASGRLRGSPEAAEAGRTRAQRAEAQEQSGAAAAAAAAAKGESGGRTRRSGGEARGAAVQTVEQLREYIRREGSACGAGECMWADDAAFAVVAQRLRLGILFVDMERARCAWPYRQLATCEGDPARYVVLKREGPAGHFVYIGAASGAAAFALRDLPNAVRALWREHLPPPPPPLSPPPEA